MIVLYILLLNFLKLLAWVQYLTGATSLKLILSETTNLIKLLNLIPFEFKTLTDVCFLENIS